MLIQFNKKEKIYMHKNIKKICITTMGILLATTTIHAAEKVKLNKTSLILEEGSS